LVELQVQDAHNNKNNQQIHERRKAFLEKFKKSECGFENFDAGCDHIQEYAHATGVYVVTNTFQMRPSSESDSLGISLLNEDTPSLRFVSTCADHAFLLQFDHDVRSLT